MKNMFILRSILQSVIAFFILIFTYNKKKFREEGRGGNEKNKTEK